MCLVLASLRHGDREGIRLLTGLVKADESTSFRWHSNVLNNAVAYLID